MAKSTKYTREIKKLARIWKSRKTVKGKRHVTWGGKRGAFAAITKAASKASAKGSGKRKPAKKKARSSSSSRKSSRKAKKPAKRKTRAAGMKKKTKRKASTAKKRYIVGGKKRAGLMTSTQARALAKRTGKKVKVAATQGAGKRKPKGMSTGAKVLLGLTAVAVVGGAAYGVHRVIKHGKKGYEGDIRDQGEEDEF